MTTDVEPTLELDAAVHRNRERLASIRARARKLFDGGATGIQVAAGLSEGYDAFILDLFEAALQAAPPGARNELGMQAALVAVGGTGRGDPAPYSDIDLLCLCRGSSKRLFEPVAAQLVRDFWDAGVKLGHAIRTVGETVALAREEPQVATALIEARLLWGSSDLFDELRRRFHRRVVRRRRDAFVNDCLAARNEERSAHGGRGTQLQPDVKRSVGGLRDLQLIRWIGFAHYGTADIESLRLKGALKRTDARRLLAAQEFLTRIRCDLHLTAEAEQDVLTREEQLRIAENEEIRAPSGQRPVEVFMQKFFQHSTALAQIARRFAALHRPESTGRKLFRSLLSHRVNGSLRVRPDAIDVPDRELSGVCSSLESILELYRSAAWYGVDLSPRLVDTVTHTEPALAGHLSPRAAALFLDILKRPGNLGAILRSMHETGILELVIPNMAHARCLLQFNQYHHYTVDEHTLRTIEAAEAFQQDDGPIGTAYRAVRHKEILHLALLLHDLGKGFEEDHSDVGKVIAETIARRIFLPDHHRETLVLLVHKHLKMTHTAFRRDCSDPDLLMEFSREIGSAETLRMLYVHSAADLTGVGPGVFTDWKADLLTDLFDRTMLILSGKPYRHHEKQRLKRIKQEVCERLAQQTDIQYQETWSKQLDTFSPHYLTATLPERIADDLKNLQRLSAEQVLVEGHFDAETETVEYRVLVDAPLSKGCFHRITGALAAKRLEILTAQICTTDEGRVVDRFRVIDPDYTGPVPPDRVEEVTQSIRSALQQTAPVESLFRRFQRYGEGNAAAPVSDQQTRVVIDNDSSERCTVIDVFAHDRRGLLYTLTRTIFELDLSVILAKISTHLDQVVDVFYVTDFDGRKIRDGDRLKSIRAELSRTIEEFERNGYREFVS